MEASIQAAVAAINTAKAYIQSQKLTISGLRTQLAGVSAEYADYKAAEEAEDVEEASLLEQLNSALSGLTAEAQDEAA
ncbi:MAG: hypothetical protein MUE44_08080 [Oscillatoriaceae cyanobacterium Prado104]|jgi:hypothetical protein|nr:hypothetical protein [Oscillatoriaceae cyanobacterium Prado104]